MNKVTARILSGLDKSFKNERMVNTAIVQVTLERAVSMGWWRQEWPQ